MNNLELIKLVIVAGLGILAGIAVHYLLLRRGSDDEANTGKEIEKTVRDEFRLSREHSAKEARSLREEVATAQKASGETIISTIGQMQKAQQSGLDAVEKRVKVLVDSNEARLDKLRETIDEKMKVLQASNEKKLDQMRQTVDEKLQSTLEKRLGESFKQVSERLEAVQRGLGEMKTLAAGVGDLQRVLTNVKTRGTWGEVQLGALLEQILTADQFQKDVQTKHDSRETVEYAIKLPGPDDNPDSPVWLPVDSKFPQEDYQRLIEASESADAEAVNQNQAALIRAIRKSAKDISTKYLDPPHTTDFGIMFLPTEGLYSEIARQPGLLEQLQHDYRIVVAGPSNISAFLNALRMGFRTLAIEQRSSEVWGILAAVKTEFGKFGHVLGKVKRQLDTASHTIELTTVRTRAMERKLRKVEELPTDDSSELLGIDETEQDDTDSDEE